jgi:iron complex transport system permease protein
MNKRNLIILITISFVIILASLFMAPSLLNPLNSSFTSDGVSKTILYDIRLPRVITALLVGAALGASGAVLQGILRNPLADPYILGISSGAALLAALGLIFGLTIGTLSFGLSVPLLAFTGAVVSCAIVASLGYKDGRIWPERILLAGIGLGFLFTAVLLLMLSLSTDSGLRRAMLWIFGDLSMAEPTLIPIGGLLIITGLVIAVANYRGLNALMLGDDMAHSLGFNPEKTRVILFVTASLMTGAAVSLGGIIGFIGLLMPHIVRFSIGSDSRLTVPLSAITGAAALAAADAIGRSVIAPSEIPSGIITALIGAPYFLYLLRRRDIVSR